MGIKHEDVFKYFWELDYPDGIKAYSKYIGYIATTKKYYLAPGPEDPESGNGVTLDFFQDKEYYEFPPEGK